MFAPYVTWICKFWPDPKVRVYFELGFSFGLTLPLGSILDQGSIFDSILKLLFVTLWLIGFKLNLDPELFLLLVKVDLRLELIAK